MKKKKQGYYSEEFKWEVVQEVLSGRMTKEGARKAYGIASNCAILYWIRKFSGNEDYRKGGISTIEMKDMSKSKREIDLEQQVKQLQESLERERLRADLWQEIVSIAESNLNIDITKKSGAKQLPTSNQKKEG